MIRSSKVSLKFANKNKRTELEIFLNEYQRIVQGFVNILWEMDKVPQLLPKEIIKSVDTWLSARMKQCAGKQASGIVRGTLQKQKQRMFIIKKLNKEKDFIGAQRLQKIYDKNKANCPVIKNIEAELDGRFIKFDLDNETSFDGWLTIASIGNRMKLVIPFKRHKHFNKLLENGILKNGIRLSRNKISFNFEIKPQIIEVDDSKSKTIGIDVGQTTVLTTSKNQQIERCNHGHSYKSICDKMARQRKGSNAFRRSQTHRTNFINWSINQLNLKNIKQVHLEDIKNLRKRKRISRSLSHWNYAELFDRLEKKLELFDVQIVKINPAYTSQKCSECGWTHTKNRKNKIFKCVNCNFTTDADLNASFNINEISISKVNQECIVPDNPKTQNSYISCF